MPRRSTGCERCRQRKVRCDEEKPQCRRCVEYGVQCSGYRPPREKDLHFVDQTRYTARKAGSELVQQRPLVTVETASKQYQWRHQFYEPTARNPVDISKHNLHRVQLLSTFLDLYLPQRQDKSMMSHFAYIANLPHVDLSSPLLQISVDTLCLAELGSLYQDERCLHESQARYTRALPMLAKELAKPKSKQMREDHILAVITVLALCELFDAIARSGKNGQGWISHLNGAQEYIRANGLQCIRSELGWLIFHNIRHSSLCAGLARRKAVLFAQLSWLKVTKDWAKEDPFIALYDIAVQVPGVLERADAFSNTGGLLADFAPLCKLICQLRSELDDWLLSRYISQGKKLYKIVDVRDMKEFAEMCLDRTFQTVFSFDSVQICTQLQLYWTSCLVLDFTLLSISRRNHEIDYLPMVRLEDFTPRKEEDIQRDSFVAATNYCRSVPFSCEPETASIGRLGTFLLRTSQSYFEESGHCRELEWCKAVRSMLQSNFEVKAPTTPEKPNDEVLASAPWNKRHECKSPICNFRVECLAPAPLLLTGKYPNGMYAPKGTEKEEVINHQSAVDDPTRFREMLNAGYLSKFRGKKIDSPSLSPSVQSRANSEESSISSITEIRTTGSILKANGASVFADEWVHRPGDNALLRSTSSS